MTTETIEKIKTALVIYLATAVLGAAMALVAWDSDYLLVVPGLLGTLICWLAGLFGQPVLSGEQPRVSEERT